MKTILLYTATTVSVINISYYTEVLFTTVYIKIVSLDFIELKIRNWVIITLLLDNCWYG